MLIIVIGFGSTGCAMFKNPISKWNNATTKVAAAKASQEKIEKSIVDMSKEYIYSTKLALQADPSTNRFKLLATDFNEKAVATLGTPSVARITYLEMMVKNLASDNATLVKKGEKQYKELNETVAELQQDKNALESKLESAQTKLEKVGTENAAYAQKWTTIMKVLWGTVYVICGIIIIRVVCIFLPPPYNSISVLVDIPFGILTKIISSVFPGSKTVAGVVSSEYKTTTEQLLLAIQNLKTTNPEMHSKISEAVSNTIDSNIIPTVNKTKADLNIVS